MASTRSRRTPPGPRRTDKAPARPARRLPWMELPAPTSRSLRVFAFDPSVGGYCDNRTTLKVPWEPLQPGPVGAKVAVVDYDVANGRYYPPVHLDDPVLLAREGMDPSESDPRFHQQMVYAVASRMIEMFEVALGRDITWRWADRFGDANPPDAWLRRTGDIRVLNLYPHAIHDANAFYSPEAHGILFGYFTADAADPGRNRPGQRVFTCLSHDIIAHEVTHAIVDGIRTYFTEPTNPDVLAFHEGFADLCALFSHFSLSEALLDTIRRTGGRLYETTVRSRAPESDDPKIAAQIREGNPLIALAQQFGEARGSSRGLRSALGTPPNPDDIRRRVSDPHFRGSILVSAVFDAYFSVYMRRAEDLFSVLRAEGRPITDELPELLAQHLARVASDTADFFFLLCARALDFCPPIDITFGDFLRALITVAGDLRPDDHEVRDALMEAFRLRGIYAEDASFYSLDALTWPRVPRGSIPSIESVPIAGPDQVEVTAGLAFGGPNGLTTDEKDQNGRVLRAWVHAHRERLGLDPDLPVSVPSFHQVFRRLPTGRVHVEMVVEVLQSRSAHVDPADTRLGSFPFRGGVTLVIDGPDVVRDPGSGRLVSAPPEIRFVIGKSISGDTGKRRLDRQRAFALSQGIPAGIGTREHQFQADFALLHGGW